MKFTNKQIKRILNIQEFIAITNTLSKLYCDFENKEFIIDTFTDRNTIYRIYCASIYNLIKAIQESKEFFISSQKYKEFEEIINQEYVADDNKYYNTENYRASLFKILETIRNQVNHSLKDDDDNNILFEAYVDFKELEHLRIIIIDIYDEIYNKIDKFKIKEIVLNKSKIRYSLDKISNKVEDLKLKIPKSENRLNKIFKKDNERALELFEQLFNNNNLYDLFMKEPEVIEKFDLADKELQESFKNYENYIDKNGTELEKESLKILKKFIIGTEKESIKDTNKKLEELKQELTELTRKYEGE